MPRHKHTYDDEVHDAKHGVDDDDDYDVKQHPSSKRAKELKKPQEGNRYVEEEHKVPRAMHGAIIGPKGAKLRQIEEDTKCQLDIPRREQNSDSIYICGAEADVRRAKKLLDDIVKEAELLNLRRGKGGDLVETAKVQTAFPTLPGEERVVMQLDVEKFAHGKVIGSHATRLSDLKKRLTAPSSEHAVFAAGGVDVVVPRQDDVSSIISIHMPKSLAPRAEKIVKEFFEYYEILEHLRSVKVVEGLSMVGDNAPQLDAARSQSTANDGRGGRKGNGGGKAAATAAAVGVAPAPAPAAAAVIASSSPPASPKERVGATDVQLTRNQRRSRQPVAPLVDLVEVGYTHRVLPTRSF